ncbi:MAG: hypothetical protein GPJ54_04415 [Candidatus Heimdallarchaeota archaeon]|nr:hypothetical protein [Candidatus Heimdallarchaeota archaeon]
MDISTDTTGVTSDMPEDSVEKELIYVFFTEYKHLLDVFKLGIDEIMQIGGNKQKAFKEIFRVYHTLKGDSAYFPEFSEFTKFITDGCDDVRDVSEDQYYDQALITKLNLDYSKMSSILFAADLMGDPSISHFQAFLTNF